MPNQGGDRGGIKEICLVLELALVGSTQFEELERQIDLTFLNPVDLSRILMLLQLDVSALMGYTGAVFNEFLGSTAGVALAYACLGLWVVLPMVWAERVFRKKDL